MTIQLEEGKFYRDYRGNKVGPMKRVEGAQNEPKTHSWFVPHQLGRWSDAGTSYRRENAALAEEWVDEPATEALAILTNTPEAETFGPLDIKSEVLAEAGRIVNGARRSAYGTPEMNFERIARFWQVYFLNTGRDVEITAADVSPMMRLMKEARLCETPDHYDSFVDIVGYTLTGAEVNKVKSPK